MTATYSSKNRISLFNYQLDYVFASQSMADSTEVRALNGVEEWEPSDHCGIEIEVN